MNRTLRGSLTLCLLFAQSLSASDADLVVPVKTYEAPKVVSPMDVRQPMLADPDRPQPTTPGGKLPQYQLGHNRRVDESAKADDSVLKFILALPDFPVVIEATITVDGKSFRQPREERVQRLLEFAKTSDSQPQPEMQREEDLQPEIQAAPEQEPAIDTNTPTEAESKPTSEKEVEKSDSADSQTETVESKNEVEVEVEVDTTPAVDAYTPVNSIEERIRRYIAATEAVPTADEIRWMLTQRVDGPVVLFLNDNFQRFRADQIPVFRILDRDRDGVVSAKELSLATDTFAECDLNRDDIVQHVEIAEVAADPRDEATHAGPGRLIYDFPTAKTADALQTSLSQHFMATDSETQGKIPRFDTDGDGQLSVAEIELLQMSPADVQVRISFDTKDKSAATLKVTGVSEAFSEATKTAVSNPYSLTLKLGQTQVEFSAVQSSGSDQIAIGAVNDGYPMLPLIDPNDDGQFTIRELRQLNDLLANFDVNKDGALTKEENRPTIRLCIGLGAIVHSELAALRSIQPQEIAASVSGPDWFVQMDVNKDNDLSGREFSGNKEQFAAMDADSDQLISSEEALEYEASLKESK